MAMRTPMARTNGLTGWWVSDPTGSASRLAMIPAATAKTPLPKVASANVFGSQSDGKPRRLCSETIQASNVERRSDVLTPPSTRPSIRRKNAGESLHMHDKAYVPQKIRHIFFRPCLSALHSVPRMNLMHIQYISGIDGDTLPSSDCHVRYRKELIQDMLQKEMGSRTNPSNSHPAKKRPRDHCSDITNRVESRNLLLQVAILLVQSVEVRSL